MHDYAIFEHDRANIGRWLGVASILLAGAFAQLFSWLNNISGIDAFLKASISTGIIYFILHWLFNKLIWKINLLDIPNIQGRWHLNGSTLNEDGKTKYEWQGDLEIEQTWKQIQISLETEKSQSQSYTATLFKRTAPRGGWVLSYSYKNEPKLEYIHEMNAHKGYCEIEFDKAMSEGKATYFNSGGRRTYGVMNLNRSKND